MVSLVLPTATMATTPPPTRPATLKRDSTYMTPVSREMSPAKKLKVAFSDDVDIRILEGWTNRPQDLVHEEVQVAIDSHLRRTPGQNDSAYEQLRLIFAAVALDKDQNDSRADGFDLEPMSSALLKQYLAALLRRVGDLRGCNTLVNAILDMNWFGRKEDFASLYTKFVGVLASVHPGFLKQIMENTVRHFVSLPSSHGRIVGESIVRKRQMLASLHSALRYLLQLIPAATDALSEAIKAQFPNHRTTDFKDYTSYIRNLFRISSYAPELRPDIFSLTTERLVKIDVEIQKGIEVIEDEVDEDSILLNQKQTNYFLDDDTSDDSDAESDVSDDLDELPEERQLKLVRDRIAKLDAGMDFLFKNYSETISADTPTEEFDQLLSLFTTFVLPTYRSRHLQFLVFHFSQLDVDKSARFVSRCVAVIQGHGTSTAASVFGAAYLASFIARGTHVPRSLVQDAAIFLVQRINTLRVSYDKYGCGPDIGRYQLFYASVQALLYIFCFRWREMLFNTSLHSSIPDDDLDYEASKGRLAIPGLRECLYQAIHSKLNPLKVCAPPIVSQFVAMAQHLKYFSLFSLLETNKRVRLSTFRTYGGTTQGTSALAKRDSALSAKAGESHHQLDAFFPFDPYKLPRSGRWLEGDYNEWRGIAGMQYADDDEEEEEEEEEDEEIDDSEEEDLERVPESDVEEEDK